MFDRGHRMQEGMSETETQRSIGVWRCSNHGRPPAAALDSANNEIGLQSGRAGGRQVASMFVYMHQVQAALQCNEKLLCIIFLCLVNRASCLCFLLFQCRLFIHDTFPLSSCSS